MHINLQFTDKKASILGSVMDGRVSYQEESSFILHITKFCWFFIGKFSFPLINQLTFNWLKKKRGIRPTDWKKKPVNILRLEISAEKMNELLAQRQICATDVHCLDINSKQCLKKLCLKTCLYNLHSQHKTTQTSHSDPVVLSEITLKEQV